MSAPYDIFPASASEVKPTARDMLVVVDVQNDFLPGGPLAVPDGAAVIAPINKLVAAFDNVAVTQDWHTPDHISFAASHPSKQVLDVVETPYGSQVLWPVHAVQGTKGAELSPNLDVAKAQLVIRKGYAKDIDSYSSFVEADRRTRGGLAGYLRERGIERVFLAGLATDFCVGWTALDARQAGFEVLLIEDACRAIDANGSLDRAIEDMKKAGVKKTTVEAVLA